MSDADAALGEVFLDFLIEFHESHGIGHGGAAFADATGNFFLSEVELSREAAVGGGLFNGIKIGSLEILDEGQFEDFLIGGFADDDSAMRGTALRDRIGQHHASIGEAENMKVGDFRFRALVVDEIFIPLGENMLIEQFRPVWNLVIDGFGNKDPGRRRKDQYRSEWDVLHPGRKFAEKLGENPILPEKYEIALTTFFETGRVLKPRKPATASGVEQTDEE